MRSVRRGRPDRRQHPSRSPVWPIPYAGSGRRPPASFAATPQCLSRRTAARDLQHQQHLQPVAPRNLMDHAGSCAAPPDNALLQLDNISRLQGGCSALAIHAATLSRRARRIADCIVNWSRHRCPYRKYCHRRQHDFCRLLDTVDNSASNAPICLQDGLSQVIHHPERIYPHLVLQGISGDFGPIYA